MQQLPMLSAVFSVRRIGFNSFKFNSENWKFKGDKQFLRLHIRLKFIFQFHFPRFSLSKLDFQRFQIQCSDLVFQIIMFKFRAVKLCIISVQLFEFSILSFPRFRLYNFKISYKFNFSEIRYVGIPSTYCRQRFAAWRCCGFLNQALTNINKTFN